jgi:hypothetical protein
LVYLFCKFITLLEILFIFSFIAKVDGRIILRWIFREKDVGMWTGSSWHRIGTGGGNL